MTRTRNCFGSLLELHTNINVQSALELQPGLKNISVVRKSKYLKNIFSRTLRPKERNGCVKKISLIINFNSYQLLFYLFGHSLLKMSLPNSRIVPKLVNHPSP